jgi:toxin-antitoxin system PIN domain toxin
MILVDANLLVYAHASSVPQHEGARRWLEQKLGEAAPVGLAWESLLAMVRLLSNPRVFPRAVTVAEAWSRAEALLSADPAWIAQPTERHRDVLGRLLRTPGLAARHVPDAHLAALAIEHGLTLCSTDADFARFEGLRWEDPLRSA